MALLRKKDIVERFKLPRSTVSDWINEFNVYIPTVKEGGSLYYKPEAIDVLNVIKELRDMGQPKPEIMRMLAERGFPITVEDAVEEIQQIVSRADYRDNLLTVMQSVGQALAQVVEQGNEIKRHDGAITELATVQKTLIHKQSDTDGRMTELERTLAEVTKQLAEAQRQTAAAQAAIEEERSKSFFRKLFGK